MCFLKQIRRLVLIAFLLTVLGCSKDNDSSLSKDLLLTKMSIIRANTTVEVTQMEFTYNNDGVLTGINSPDFVYDFKKNASNKISKITAKSKSVISDSSVLIINYYPNDEVKDFISVRYQNRPPVLLDTSYVRFMYDNLRRIKFKFSRVVIFSSTGSTRVDTARNENFYTNINTNADSTNVSTNYIINNAIIVSRQNILYKYDTKKNPFLSLPKEVRLALLDSDESRNNLIERKSMASPTVTSSNVSRICEYNIQDYLIKSTTESSSQPGAKTIHKYYYK